MSQTMNTVFPAIRTARLFLRPLQATDAGPLHRIYQSEEVLRYVPIPSPPSPEQMERFVARQQAHWETHCYGHWGLLPDGEEEIIGWAGLGYLRELDETEVAYMIDQAFWGKGYATEAALAALRFGFEEVKLDHIIALVHPDNLASRRVIDKCGMAYVDTLCLWGMELLRHRRAGTP
jgi:RimJ/RimL family protein N-acetyltransferase